MIYYRLFYIFIILLSLLFIQCANPGDDPTSDLGPYRFDVGNHMIKPEYLKYLMVREEIGANVYYEPDRDIWVGGKHNKSTNIWWSNSYNPGVDQHGNFCWKAMGTKNIDTKKDIYYATLRIAGDNIPSNIAQLEYSLRIGSFPPDQQSTSSCWIKFINPRKYHIEYNHQAGYDVLSRSSTDWEAKLMNAFNGASTTIVKQPGKFPYSSNLQTRIVDVVSNNQTIDDDRLWIYVRDNASPAYRVSGAMNAYRYKTALLYGIKDIKVYERINGVLVEDNVSYKDATGLSTCGQLNVDDVDPLPYYSVIIADRIESAISDINERKKEFTRVIIHELGHQRGIAVAVSHKYGHKGTDSLYCVMRDGEYQSEIRNNPVFCEGHRQRLLNKHFSGE